LSRPDFRAAAARRLSEDRELGPAIVSLLSPEEAGRTAGVRVIPVDRIEPNPDQPRMAIDESTIDELAASIREHGVLQPILVRPLGGNRWQLIAGERRWRASVRANLETIPALIEDIDDDTALEISIIENLQREDLSPLDEAMMFDRMVHEHGYSIRRLAQKLGKDKGYLENRLRLADAPDEIKELVSVRKDTLSHAYELLKVADPKKRRRLAEAVGRGELSLVKLREKIEGRRRRSNDEAEEVELVEEPVEVPRLAVAAPRADGEDMWSARASTGPMNDDSLVQAKQHLADAVEGLMDVLRVPAVVGGISEVDRANLAKYLTIAKLRLENAIAAIRAGEPRD
jgi:ParB family transcriptional regulator, chromosome partitioning protein